MSQEHGLSGFFRRYRAIQNRLAHSQHSFGWLETFKTRAGLNGREAFF